MLCILYWVWSIVAVASCAFSKPVAEPQATLSPGLSDHSCSLISPWWKAPGVCQPTSVGSPSDPAFSPACSGNYSLFMLPTQTLLKDVVLHLGTVVDHLTWDILGNTLYWDFRIILAGYDELYPLLPTFPLWLEKSTKLGFFICF